MFRERKSIILIVTFLSAFILIFPLSLRAAVRIVPDVYPTIQQAIDAANADDTVIVKSGWYGENLTLKTRVKVLGQGRSNTYLYGGRTGNVVNAVGIEDAQIDGFTIYGSGVNPDHSGVMISGSNRVTVSNNLIFLNTIGISVTGNSPSIIKNNIIYLNVYYGLKCLDSNPIITNNQINRNLSCGVYLQNSSGAKFINNTVVDNYTQGIWCDHSSPLIKNNISKGNSTGISASNSGIPQISYNCVYDNTLNYDPQSGGIAAAGVGDISENPLLLGQLYEELYLDNNSPCIDAGDPDPIYNDVGGSRNDMGASGGEGGICESTQVSETDSGFMFTSIGKIPVSEISTEGLSEGLVNVSSEVAGDLHIPSYSDAPFGGWLWLNGQFGYADENVRYYQIRIAKWNGIEPVDADFSPLTDTLTKIKYTPTSDGKVLAQRIPIGPLPDTSLPGLYLRTDKGYWAHPYLKLIFNTRNYANGKYDLDCKAYDANCNEILTLPEYENYSRITLIIDNSPVQTEIHQVAYDTNQPIEECEIITLDDPNSILKFTITARHPNGYLKDYVLIARYGTNDVLGNVWEDHHIPGTLNWPGVQSYKIDSSSLPQWEICAYQFHLWARARTTDGFHYIYGSNFRDHYYIIY